MKLRCRDWLIYSLATLGLLTWGVERTWSFLSRGAASGPDEYEPPPPGMVFVPGGEFLMGCDNPHAEPDERPLRKVRLPAFYIDKFEVTNRRFREFKPNYRYPAGEDELPVTFVRKSEAEAFCLWAGRRLPTSAEWEKAARGTDGREYPWGNTFSAERANISRRTARDSVQTNLCLSPSVGAKGTLPVGSFPLGASPYGCEDMAGNAWEWVSDVWSDKNALGMKRPGEARGILRGGAYSYSPKQARTAYQGFEALGTTCHDVGFRCAMDATLKRKYDRRIVWSAPSGCPTRNPPQRHAGAQRGGTPKE